MAYVKHNFQPMDILHASEMNEIDEQVYQNSIQSYAKIVTQAEYDALSEAEKNSNVVYYVSDAPFDSPNVVTLTRAEYNALSEADKMDGRFYYITDDEEVATSLVVQTNQNNSDTVPSSAVLYSETSAIRDALTSNHTWNLVKANASTNVQINVPSGYTECFVSILYSAGQRLGFIVPKIAGVSLRVDSGFYYTNAANGSGAAVYNASANTIVVYKPQYAGAEVTPSDISIWGR